MMYGDAYIPTQLRLTGRVAASCATYHQPSRVGKADVRTWIELEKDGHPYWLIAKKTNYPTKTIDKYLTMYHCGEYKV